MKFFLAATLVLATIFPHALANVINCMAPPPTDAYKSESLAIHEAAQKRDSEQGLQARAFKRRRINVGVHFTIVTSGPSKEEGHISQDSVNTQMMVLNQGFNRAGFKFWLKSVKYTTNAGWANSNGDPGLEDRQRKLRRGDYKSLNFIVIPGMSNGGRCTYPGQFHDNILLFDRCELGTAALPNTGTGALGRVAVHEVGHWLGLMHTFENGCGGNGDQVDDTPAHEHNGPIARCPAQGQEPDSCPGEPGRDPVHNFMSYFEEKCWNNNDGFTDGQIRRMYQQWDHFRAGAPPTKLN